MLGNRGHDLAIRWIKGLTYRSLGELDQAEAELRYVWKKLASGERNARVDILSLDLASVLVEQGKMAESEQLAQQAGAVAGKTSSRP